MVSVVLPFLFASKPQVTAWVVGYNPKSVEHFEKHASQIDAVFTEYYTIAKDGSLIRRGAEYKKVFDRARGIAKKNKVQFLGMLNNYAVDDGVEIGFEPKRASKVFATKESREKFSKDVVRFLKEDGAEGIDLDLESLVAGDKDRYSAFAAALAKELHQAGMKLSVTVHPKDNLEGNWDGPKAHDYKALGAVADRFNVMTYDFSWTTGPEGPIAPNAWVERVTKFAATQVSPSKLGMGIPCYGYDWGKKPTGSVDFADLPSMKNAKVDPESGELILGKLHFSGAEAFRQKYALASKLGVGSVAFWYCGSEDSTVWDFLPKR